ncbi:MAG: alpha/beta hydrolase [Flavobacteriales bacterium]
MKQQPLYFLMLFLTTVHFYAQKHTIKFSASDDVIITADTYLTKLKNAPFIILFHQARFSRGEYLEIAPKLNQLGFNCIAIDQRSGNKVNDIVNQTHISATAIGKATQYPDAIPDLEATLKYVNENYQPSKIIIWGSSYSSALVLYIASQHPTEIDGVLSFSPGEYFTINNQKIKNFAAQVTCPVFITSAKDEQEYWQDIYNAIPSKKTYFLPKTAGKHGSKALWNKNQGNETYWKAVKSFLNQFLN